MPTPSAECPTATPAETVSVDFFESPADYPSDWTADAERSTLDFLNKFGGERLAAELRRAGKDKVAYRSWGIRKPPWVYQDLTNDGVPEFAFAAIDVYVMGCNNGRYETLLHVHPDWNPGNLVGIAEIRDLNLDGVPEFVVLKHGGWHIDLYVYEWNGQTFDLMTRNDEFEYLYMQGGVESGPTEFDLTDIDGNGTFEIVFQGGIPTNFDRLYYGPWRVRTDLYEWNGSKYLLARESYSAAQYRFQAVQDGDRATRARHYEEALEHYQAAIFSDQLEWWSPERSTYTSAKNEAEVQGQPAPTPPSNNPDEYYQLAAYSRYRIMLLHLLQGSLDGATVVYETLQARFSAGTPGNAYAEMAAEFWAEYQLSQNLPAACEKAIDYARTHPEILTPLGSTYHGWQSLNYQPSDVCFAP